MSDVRTKVIGEILAALRHEQFLVEQGCADDLKYRRGWNDRGTSFIRLLESMRSPVEIGLAELRDSRPIVAGRVLDFDVSDEMQTQPGGE